MESLNTPFLCTTPIKNPRLKRPPSTNPKKNTIACSIKPDPWTLSDGNNSISRRYKKQPKKPLSDDNARRIIKGKARYLSVLRRNQGSHAQTPKWIQRTPQQMVQYLEDDRDGHLYGKHVVAAIRIVRSLSSKPEGSYNMREVMSSFVTKLTFKEMCIVLKEQKGWRQVRDFFDWMKLQGKLIRKNICLSKNIQKNYFCSPKGQPETQKARCSVGIVSVSRDRLNISLITRTYPAIQGLSAVKIKTLLPSDLRVGFPSSSTSAVRFVLTWNSALNFFNKQCGLRHEFLNFPQV